MSLAAIIVTTRNSGMTIEACLRSVRAQTVPELQIVVIDNFSADRTPAIARLYADVFDQAGPERSRQRNLGAAMASSPYLMFLDSDMILPPSIVQESLEQAEQGARAVIVSEVSVGQGYWAACKSLERSCYVGDDSIEAPRFIERRLFEELAGFDEDLTGEEDWDIAERVRQSGARIGRAKTLLVHDEGRLKLTDTMRTKFYYGRTMSRYIRKHPRVARRQLVLFRSAFLKHRDSLARRPWLSAGVLFMKICEGVAGGLGTMLGAWLDWAAAHAEGSTPSTSTGR